MDVVFVVPGIEKGGCGAGPGVRGSIRKFCVFEVENGGWKDEERIYVDRAYDRGSDHRDHSGHSNPESSPIEDSRE